MKMSSFLEYFKITKFSKDDMQQIQSHQLIGPTNQSFHTFLGIKKKCGGNATKILTEAQQISACHCAIYQLLLDYFILSCDPIKKLIEGCK